MLALAPIWFLLCLLAAAPVHAQTEHQVPDTWGLKPDGVAREEPFRLIFVSSSTRSAKSDDIADYNRFVRNRAAAGHPDIRPYADGFAALGSTEGVNARANTLTRASDTDAPVYWVDATATRDAVADGYADLYDATWGGDGPRDEAGTSVAASAATGTNLAGTTPSFFYVLGNNSHQEWVIVWGNLSGTLTASAGNINVQHRFLAVSPMFRVAPASTGGLFSLAVEDAAGNALSLDPGFAMETAEYAVAVATRRATVRPTPWSSQATVEYLDNADAPIADLDDAAEGLQLDLRRGENTVKVRVTATDGDVRIYTVTLTVGEAGLVSNLGTQAQVTLSNRVVAQRFTTGDNLPGYRLVGASVPVADVGASLQASDTYVTVWSHDSGPDEQLEALVSPATLEANRTNIFTGDLLLDPATSYWLMVNHGRGGGGRLQLRLTNFNQESSHYGWTIADSSRWSTDADFSSPTTSQSMLRMRVEGYLLESADCAVDLGGRTEVWSGEVVPALDPPMTGYGYDVGRYGELPDPEFDFGSTTGAEVLRAFVTFDGRLVLKTDLPAEDTAALRLHVCGEVFDLADAPPDERGVQRWADTGLDWAFAPSVGLALSASPDATLSALSVEAGTLDQAFDPDVLEYEATVPYGTARATILHTVAGTGATVDFLDDGDAALADADDVTDGYQVDLAEGAATTVKIQVTAGDGQATRTYVLTVGHGPSTRALVSNLGETTLDTFEGSLAQSFRTGPAPEGYAVVEVGIELGALGADGAAVEIWEDDAGAPGSLVAALANPGSFAAGAVNAFAAPAGTALDPDTTYWIVKEAAADEHRLARTASGAETGEPGWTVGDGHLSRASAGDPWSVGTGAVKVEIRGPGANVATLRGLTLGGMAVPVDPDTTEYATLVDNGVSRITVAAATSDTRATVEYLDAAPTATRSPTRMGTRTASKWISTSAKTPSRCG
ncbi:MAG: cadherin-like beta sandwich domain-containing protein [Acidobacteriota bacterium]|nr:cadherin-like beta sandwich domain-containing protein [Acidobacteriota bacterium]